MESATASSSGQSIYLSGEYLEKTSSWHVEDSPWKADEIGRLLHKNKIAPKTIAEVGCGAGEILRQLSTKIPDAKFFGYEISPQAFELCKSRADDRVTFHNADITTQDVFFDTLLCIDVFEHVEDYMGFLKSIKTKAEYKVFHIPIDISVLSVLRDGQISARNSVGHIHYFTPPTALATLTDCGYTIIDSYFTTPFDDVPGTSLNERLARIPRRILYAISPKLMVKMMGGCSLIVLAK
jgi:hypothetical protein